MNHAPIHYATVAEQAALLRSRAVSPVELTRAYLDRIDHHDSRLRAYITVLSDSALRQAEEAEREIASGQYRGPLHGIPVALKDIIHVGGVPTTAGSRVMTGFVPREDSNIVRRLRRSGAVILGKANLSEFAMGGTVDHPYGTPRNPWNTSMTPGASSSGSGVAVAAGLCSAALGSDTGGSIRGPAFFCGIAGLRPTYGRVTRHGVVPMCWSMDTVGPMARSVEDCAILLSAIAGHDSADPSSVRAPVPDYTGPIEDGGRGLRIGIPGEMIDFDGMDGRGARRGLRRGLHAAGAGSLGRGCVAPVGLQQRRGLRGDRRHGGGRLPRPLAQGTEGRLRLRQPHPAGSGLDAARRRLHQGAAGKERGQEGDAGASGAIRRASDAGEQRARPARRVGHRRARRKLPRVGGHGAPPSDQPRLPRRPPRPIRALRLHAIRPPRRAAAHRQAIRRGDAVQDRPRLRGSSPTGATCARSYRAAATLGANAGRRAMRQAFGVRTSRGRHPGSAPGRQRCGRAARLSRRRLSRRPRRGPRLS